MQNHNDAMMTSGHRSLEKYTSHFIERVVRERELETKQNCNILTPTLMAIIQPVDSQGYPLDTLTGCTCYLHRCISYFDRSAGVNMQQLQWGSYSFAELQLVYSTAPANWAPTLREVMNNVQVTQHIYIYIYIYMQMYTHRVYTC